MKTIAVITGTRAEYGLLRPVIKELLLQNILNVKVIVTGAHLTSGTEKEIINDNIHISERIDILKFTPGRIGIAKTTAYAVQKFIEYFDNNRPSGILILGDRYEIFAAATAARLLCIPIFHISGGDVTNGALDDCFRHCITKMSTYHFPTCDVYAKRLLRLGEQPHTIFCTGGLGDENIRKLPFLSKDELSQQIEFSLKDPYILVTYHPESFEKKSCKEQALEITAALLLYNGGIIITGANADAGGDEINGIFEDFCIGRNNTKFIVSMGTVWYLSAMKYAACVVGNSSSGICETPSLAVAAVNIGARQDGRLIPQNVLCCICDKKEIITAIKKATSDDFIAQCKMTVSPYYKEGTSLEIVRIVTEKLEGDIPEEKVFYDSE